MRAKMVASVAQMQNPCYRLYERRNHYMARKDATLRTLTLAQDFAPEHWPGWTGAEKAMLGNCEEMGKIIKKRLEDGGCEIVEMYGMIHDKDEHRLWDEYEMLYKLQFSLAHIHIVVKLAPEKGKTFDELAELIGIKSNYIEKPKAGRYAYDNMLAYLTHIKYHKKYQYAPQDVITFAGKDYMEYYRERYEAWMKGRAKLLVKNTKADLDTLIAKIVKDENFTEDNIFLDRDYSEIYMLNGDKIDKVFALRRYVMGKRKIAEEKRQREAEEKNR